MIFKYLFTNETNNHAKNKHSCYHKHIINVSRPEVQNKTQFNIKLAYIYIL